MARISPLMIAPPAIFFGLATLFFVGMQRENPDELPSATVGRQAPEVVVDAVSFAEPFQGEDLRTGELTLVNFWASWCAPCRTEHPTLMQLKDAGVKIMGVNYKDNAGNAAGFIEELGDPFEKGGADPNGRMALDWGVYGVPETYVIDGDGTVLLRIAGPLTQRELAARVQPILDAQ